MDSLEEKERLDKEKKQSTRARVLARLNERGKAHLWTLAEDVGLEVDDVLEALHEMQALGLAVACTFCFKNKDGDLAYVQSWSSREVFENERASW